VFETLIGDEYRMALLRMPSMNPNSERATAIKGDAL
jgi:hypothetical protein